MMRAEAVGVEGPQRTAVWRKCLLVDIDQLYEGHARQMPNVANQVACTCEHVLHCTPL